MPVDETGSSSHRTSEAQTSAAYVPGHAGGQPCRGRHATRGCPRNPVATSKAHRAGWPTPTKVDRDVARCCNEDAAPCAPSPAPHLSEESSKRGRTRYKNRQHVQVRAVGGAAARRGGKRTEAAGARPCHRDARRCLFKKCPKRSGHLGCFPLPYS